MFRIGVMSVVVLLCGGPTATAQVCFGSAAFTSAPWRLGAIFSIDKEATTFGGQLLAGGRKGLFGGATVAAQSVDGFDGTGASVEAIVGADIPTSDGKRLYVCPVASAFAQSGPDFGANELSIRGWSGGANAGFVVHESARGVRTIVTGGFVAIHQRLTVRAPEGDSLATDNFGAARIGVGWVFEKISIIPILQFPFAIDGPGASVIYGVSVGFIF